MATFVSFSIYVDGENCLDEFTVTNNLNQYLSGLLDDRHVGKIQICPSEKTSNDRVEMEEELKYTIYMFCFHHIADLIAYQDVTIKYWSTFGQIYLSSTKDKYIHISGDYISSVKFPDEELLPALYNCGQRYINLLRMLSKQTPDFNSDIAMLESEAQIARQALEKAGLL